MVSISVSVVPLGKLSVSLWGQFQRGGSADVTIYDGIGHGKFGTSCVHHVDTRIYTYIFTYYIYIYYISVHMPKNFPIFHCLPYVGAFYVRVVDVYEEECTGCRLSKESCLCS